MAALQVKGSHEPQVTARQAGQGFSRQGVPQFLKQKSGAPLLTATRGCTESNHHISPNDEPGLSSSQQVQIREVQGQAPAVQLRERPRVGAGAQTQLLNTAEGESTGGGPGSGFL